MKTKGYGLIGFIIDLTLTALTGGIWLLFVLFRFLKK